MIGENALKNPSSSLDAVEGKGYDRVLWLLLDLLAACNVTGVWVMMDFTFFDL